MELLRVLTKSYYQGLAGVTKEFLPRTCIKGAFFACLNDLVPNYKISRLTVVNHEAKKKQHVHASSGLRDHYSELFTWMAALKFQNAVTQPP